MKAKALEILMVLCVIAFVVGCEDETEALEAQPLDPNYNLNIVEPTKTTDVMFEYYHNGVTEGLTIDIIDDEIVCSRNPEKAIEIIYKTMMKAWGDDPFIDFNDLPVRFEEPSEPNEPECEHTVISSCLVYGCDCRTCANCGKRLSDWQESYMPPDVPDELFKIDIMKHIPTWPDYIGLPRDLMFIAENGQIMIFPKGTKIYFKED